MEPPSFFKAFETMVQRTKKILEFLEKCATILLGGIAQLGEHLHHTQVVAGSSPVISTK